jgi:hypothetical protein
MASPLYGESILAVISLHSVFTFEYAKVGPRIADKNLFGLLGGLTHYTGHFGQNRQLWPISIEARHNGLKSSGDSRPFIRVKELVRRLVHTTRVL